MKIGKILKILLALFAVYIIYEIVRKLAGGSLSIEEIILTLIILNLGWTALMQRQLSSHLGEHKRYRTGRKNSKKEGEF
jgi:hypothetical protein